MARRPGRRQIVKQRYAECVSCLHFDLTTLKLKCLRCGAGEYFEEAIDDSAPSDCDLMNFYRGMNRDDDD